jgi:YesN/AraC family two-component response regulator
MTRQKIEDGCIKSNRNLQVLIVDDEPLMRERLAGYLLLEYDSNIITAVNGVQAVDMHKRFKEAIHITFLDIEMPRMNGLEALTEIRMVNPDAYIVIVSGVGTMNNVKAAMSFGVDGFIVKPYCDEKISEAMDNYAEHVCGNRVSRYMPRVKLVN